MNLQDEIWETIRNEVAYLNGGSLDARKGSLAEQAANILTPFVKDLLREAQVAAWDRGAEYMDSDAFWHKGRHMFNPYLGESNV